jgi:hypothetical protein
MAYLPKSKYSIKYTNGGLLAYDSDNTEYIGKYIETSNKTYIAGTKLAGSPLKLISPKATNMDRNPRALQYNSSKDGKDIYGLLKPKRNIPSSKPQPTEKDYKRGYFFRYFIARANEEDIVYETSKEYLDEYKATLDQHLYKIDVLRWYLIGSVSVTKNSNMIKAKTRINPYISAVLNKANEYVKPEEDPNAFKKQIDPNQMLDKIPTFTLEQWNMFTSLDKEKLILKYGKVNISDL